MQDVGGGGGPHVFRGEHILDADRYSFKRPSCIALQLRVGTGCHGTRLIRRFEHIRIEVASAFHFAQMCLDELERGKLPTP